MKTQIVKTIRDMLALDFVEVKGFQLRLMDLVAHKYEGKTLLWVQNDRDNYLFPIGIGSNPSAILFHIGGGNCRIVKGDKIIPVTSLVAREWALKLPFHPESINTIDELRSRMKEVLQYGVEHQVWTTEVASKGYTSTKVWLEYFLQKRNQTMIEWTRLCINRARLLESIYALEQAS